MSKVIEASREQAVEQAKGREQAASLSLPVILALIGVYLIWGSTYLAIRYVVVGGLPPLISAGLRFIVAGGGMYAFLRLRGAPNPTRKEWGGATIMGALLLAGGNGLVSIAELSVASGLAALMIATVPLWTTVFAHVWGYSSSRFEWLGLLVGFAGVVILNLGGDMQANPGGALLLIIAAMSWAFGTVWSRRLTLPSGMMFTAAEMLAGGGVLLAMGLARGEWFTRVPTSDAIFGWLYLVVVGSLLGFTAFNYLLMHTRPALATSYAYVNPVVAVLLGALIAGDKVSEFVLYAMPVILTGVAIVIFARSSKKEG